MTNYNERLDEILCDTLNGEGVYREYSGKVKAAGQDEAKQALTSLIKELVADAKPMVASKEVIETYLQNGMTQKAAEYHGRNHAIEQFEQNLLKALEEV